MMAFYYANILASQSDLEREVRRPLTTARQLQDAKAGAERTTKVLNNAGKFARNGSVTVRVAVQDGWMIVIMKETGVGISPEYLANLFQNFGESEGETSSKFGGTGLGLALSQKLCRLMGGDILAESEVAKGSCFTIRIPMQSTSAAWSAAQPENFQQGRQAPRVGRPKVLIIDDDPAVLDLVERILLKEGYEPLRAQSSREGLMAAWRIKPQAIILDVFMPEMDGWEVLSALKADEELKACPVVLLTVSDDVQSGRALGAAG